MKKIWIDADPGVDDTFALAMLFEAPEKIEIIGMSTVFGNVDVNQTTRNAKIPLEAANKTHLPIARGAFEPLVISLDTSPYVHGKNGMGNMPLPTPAMLESPFRAPQAIIKAIQDHPNEITLLLIGPLTNAAMALKLEPSIVELVKEVVIMGGAVRCPGNITPVAEANFYHDPHAAQIVMQAQWPIFLAPLDVCQYGLIPHDLLDKICNANKPLTPFIAGSVPFFKRFLEAHKIFDWIDFPDALAVAYLLKPGLFKVEKIPLFIETEGACMGQSVEVPSGKWDQDIEEQPAFVPGNRIFPANVMCKVEEQSFLRLIEELLV